MVKRKHKKTKSRRKTAASPRRRKMNLKTVDTVVVNNRKAHWSVYQDLQKKADRAWEKLRADVHRHAPPHILLEDRDNLLLLLGECNYMAGECVRISNSRY
jgi:hypothetical protein